MSFASPLWLLAFLPFGLLALWHLLRRRRREPVLSYSRAADWARLQGRGNWLKVWAEPTLRALAITLAILALARPQSATDTRETERDTVDMLLCLDISGSMQARDLKPDRLGAAIEVAREFVARREEDRLGLVVFGGEAITQCPLTLDHPVLDGLLEGLHVGMVEDGTAIGLAIATGLNRLKDSQAHSRVMILLTDGENNRGLDPLTARDLAQSLGVKIYTIGVGTEGMAPFPVQSPFGGIMLREIEVNIDEDLLREIATSTGGRYFRAHDKEQLVQIYEEIDRLERTTISVTEYRVLDEKYRLFLLPALGLFVLALGLSVVFRRVPA
ncbi:MAG: VWA domain-containing protein [Candidatus Cloacimonetes bacterium]|nr:VWA domain-containing protein [Candidatus Cloacimonadota bacterium]